MSRARSTAAIDLGSTSSRLLIAVGDERVERNVITHMGIGRGPDGALSPDALDRVRSTIVDFASIIDHHDVDTTRVTATAAARSAPNVALLASLVTETTGCDLDVLSADEEAATAFAGVLTDPSVPDGAVAVIDIGGNSTEIVVGSRGDGVVGSISLDVGAGRVTEEFIESDPPQPDELSAALSVLEVFTTDVRRDLPIAASVLESNTVIGVGGTITTAAAVEIGMIDYDPEVMQGFELTKEAAEDVFRTLVTESAQDRAYNPGLQPDRVDVIVGGMCVLVALMRAFGIGVITVSERDLLDGLIEGGR